MNDNNSFFKKIIKALINIAIAIVTTVTSIFILNYLRLNIFYNLTKNNYSEFTEIPDLNIGYVPQGMCYVSSKNIILQTSYNDEASSRLYVFDYNRKELICKFDLKDSSGHDIQSHVGGVASNGNKVWICGDSTLYIYNLSEILSSSENSIKSLKELTLNNSSDFCFYQYNKITNNPNESHYYNILWIGSFIVNLNPLSKPAIPLLYGYNLEKGDDITSIDNPDYTVAIPDKVQGLYIDTENNFYFSRSYSGFLSSTIDIHENILNSKTSEYLDNAKRIQYHDYRNTRRIRSIILPPMAEGIFIKDDKLYIIFESAALKYNFVKPKINKILELKRGIE